MHPDLEKLLELDKLNHRINDLNQEIAALPQRVAAIEKKLAGTQAQVDAAKAALKQIETNKRKFEAEIQTLQQKISKYRDQSLNVKTNQEYKAINDEISFAQAEIRKLEDKILDGMAETETREQELKNANAELAAERKEIEKEQTEARERTAADQKELAELTPKRDNVKGGIDENRVRHYERLVKLRGSGLGVVRDGKCMACYVMLRPQTYNDVRSDDQVVTCDSCGRFLIYYREPAETAAAAPANGVAGQQS
jgi:predicted  nucleic acid-binding Zn-ribbon protein